MAETVTKHPVGTRVRVNEPGDPRHGKVGVVDDIARTVATYPSVLVKFPVPNNGVLSRWYRQENLEAVYGEEGE